MPDPHLTAETAREYLRDAEPRWRSFWFHMHLMAKNLEEFSEGLGTISDEVFTFHVSGQKNDLARWVGEVVGDSELAHELALIKTKEDAVRVTAARVKEIRSIIHS